jgi:sirohydrochlorin ferrochelatase
VTGPTLVAVAHGSRDGRSAATVTDLIRVVRLARPDLDVRLAFLDFNAPRLAEVLAAAHADGHRGAVVVPLLLGSAYHARVDVPAAVGVVAARLPRLEVRVAEVLGPDPRLSTAALDRLGEIGVSPGDAGLGVVLAAAGSSDAAANAAVHRVALGWPLAAAAFAAATSPDVRTAARALRDRGARRVAVAPWFLAPGRLLERVRADAGPDGLVAGPLGAHPAVAGVLLDRYTDAADRPGLPGQFDGGRRPA